MVRRVVEYKKASERALHKIYDKIDRNLEYDIPYEHLLEIFLVEAYIRMEALEKKEEACPMCAKMAVHAFNLNAELLTQLKEAQAEIRRLNGLYTRNSKGKTS